MQWVEGYWGLRKEKVVRRYKRLINPSYSRILASKKEIYFRPVILTHLFEIPVLFYFFFFQTHYNFEGVRDSSLEVEEG